VALGALAAAAAPLHEGVRRGGEDEEKEGGSNHQAVAKSHGVSRLFCLEVHKTMLYYPRFFDGNARQSDRNRHAYKTLLFLLLFLFQVRRANCMITILEYKAEREDRQ
jgi:hypothetical protein